MAHHVMDINISEYRKPDHQTLDIFHQRWSPRSMSGEPVSRADWHRLLEAARWAPSSYNEQPWRYIYAFRDTEQWEPLYDCMYDANKAWAKNAGVLALITSKSTFSKNGNDNPVHVFDAGSSWQSLALQGASMGLVVHGMAGFDHDVARKTFSIPDDFTICAMLAVGHPAAPSVLPEELRGMETPNGRKPIHDWAGEGKFPG